MGGWALEPVAAGVLVAWAVGSLFGWAVGLFAGFFEGLLAGFFEGLPTGFFVGLLVGVTCLVGAGEGWGLRAGGGGGPPVEVASEGCRLTATPAVWQYS